MRWTTKLSELDKRDQRKGNSLICNHLHSLGALLLSSRKTVESTQMHFELNDRPEQVASANHSIFSSDDNKLRPSASVCLNFWICFHVIFNSRLPQLPDTAVTDLRRLGRAADADAESPTSPRVTTSNDPYNIGHGLKTDAEIAELSSRKRGKRLANYHRKQNDVCVLFLLIHCHYSLAFVHSLLLLS